MNRTLAAELLDEDPMDAPPRSNGEVTRGAVTYEGDTAAGELRPPLTFEQVVRRAKIVVITPRLVRR